MMADKKFNIVIVGGGPAGVVSAVTARRYYPDKKILLIKSVAEGVVPCGIPYMFNTLKKPEDNALGNAPLEKNKISILADRVTKITRKNKTVSTENSGEYAYEKLILAVGSNPIVPPIPGVDLKGI